MANTQTNPMVLIVKVIGGQCVGGLRLLKVLNVSNQFSNLSCMISFSYTQDNMRLRGGWADN